MAQLWGGRFTKQTDKLVYNLMRLFRLTRNSINRTLREVLHMCGCSGNRES